MSEQIGQIEPYPDKDYPWNFYFNGMLMPKWSAHWGLPPNLFDGEDDLYENFGKRDLHVLKCTIHHVGVVESADPQIFLFCIQELLLLYLEHREVVLTYLREDASHPAEEIYSGVVNGAFQMRRLVSELQMAFWTNGYEADRQCLIERMERSQLRHSAPRFLQAPHIERFQHRAHSQNDWQRTQLRRLAQSSQFCKEWRRELHQA
jgi:hypothetical protein